MGYIDLQEAHELTVRLGCDFILLKVMDYTECDGFYTKILKCCIDFQGADGSTVDWLV